MIGSVVMDVLTAKTKHLLVFLAIFPWCYQNTVTGQDENSNYDFYTAGVVEYGNVGISEREKSPTKYIQQNIEAYLHFIDLAKDQNVDILVFPEATINYFSSRSNMLANAIVIPDPLEKIAPWTDEKYSQHLRALSKKSKEKQIYVLVNLVEKVPCSESNACKHPDKTYKDGYDLYNTNVVFDREGRVISKYQKYNLFIEPFIDQPLTPQHSTFTTDFGVKFGHFICFDILFYEPALSLIQRENITNVLYPSMWFSDIPFLTSDQTHQAWAYANNVNLISAGGSYPSEGSTGSGIFIGNHGISGALTAPFTVQKLITAAVPKDPRKFIQQSTSIPTITPKGYSYTPSQMQNLRITEIWADYSIQKTNILNELQTVCANDDICCSFDIKMKTLEIPPGKIAYKYKLVANYTTRIFGENRKCGEIYCAVVACTNNNENSCGRRFKDNSKLFNAVDFDKISITAKIKYNNVADLLVMPNTLDTSILPLDTSDYSFSDVTKVSPGSKHSFKEFQMKSEGKIRNILTFGIYGRNFAADKIIKKKKLKE